uniref:guanylate cyclase n=2 Tax=Macrostomum lignano TaxID=282301 RepID=A0A1I8GKN0_9PLAT
MVANEADQQQHRADSAQSYVSSSSTASQGTTTALKNIEKLGKKHRRSASRSSSSSADRGCLGRLCHGNPLTRSGKRKQMAKIMILILVPIIALGCITISEMTAVSQRNDLNAAVRQSMRFVMETGQVIHALQRERDMTALFCGSGSSETRMIMTDRYPETDRALLQLSVWPSQYSLSLRQELQQKQLLHHKDTFRSRENFMEELSKHRRELDHFKTSLYREIRFYSELTQVFIDWVYTAIQKSRDGSLWRKMVAYVMLVICKENMGVERSLGAVFFSNGSFRGHADYQWYLQKHFVSTSNRKAASLYSEEVTINLARALNKSSHPVEKSLTVMRAEILYKNLTRKSSVLSTKWFDNMTIYMDAILEVQLRLVESVILDLKDSARDDIADLSVTISFLCITILVCPLIVITIQAVMSDVQSYALTLATQTNHLNNERQRTNELLYQMIPRSVAEQLKRGKNIAAESFDQSTIFFSDLIGFAALVSESAPIQIVDMLNAVYSCFDSRICLYNVYKVETIGDSYMVASGPVVAGVVGSKMPRYCLFGDTVNTSSRMETNGRGNAIQMTEAARNYIINDSSYVIKERGIIEVKGKTRMTTYWLLNKLGFEDSLPCMPGCPSSLQSITDQHKFDEMSAENCGSHSGKFAIAEEIPTSRVESCSNPVGGHQVSMSAAGGSGMPPVETVGRDSSATSNGGSNNNTTSSPSRKDIDVNSVEKK